MDWGRSPTVREGSAIPCPQSEPSLTVGLLPRSGQHTSRTLLSSLNFCEPRKYNVEYAFKGDRSHEPRRD
jgi:hypothetical protein